MDRSVFIALVIMLVIVCIALFALKTTGVITSEPLKRGQTTAVLTTEKGQTFAQPTEFETTKYYHFSDSVFIAKVLYNECRGVPSRTERACVAWVILNRVDAWGKTVSEVVKADNQFAYSEDTPVDAECMLLAQDVLSRWEAEKNGFSMTGRVLPSEYLFFVGDGAHNHFRDKFSGNYKLWDYSLDSPYKD